MATREHDETKAKRKMSKATNPKLKALRYLLFCCLEVLVGLRTKPKGSLTSLVVNSLTFQVGTIRKRNEAFFSKGPLKLFPESDKFTAKRKKCELGMQVVEDEQEEEDNPVDKSVISDDGWEIAGTDTPSTETQSTLPQQERERERDLFIPIFSLVSLAGLFGAYGYEMFRLYLRGELYLPWNNN